MKWINLINRYKDLLNIIGIVFSLGYFAYIFYQNSLNLEQIEKLTAQNETLKLQNLRCEEHLSSQNKAIDALKIKALQPIDTQKIEKIYIKDNSCQSQLNAYKALFGGKK